MYGGKLTMKSQLNRILGHLKKGKSITPIDALQQFGCFRLGGRIFDLRSKGHDITTKMVGKPGERKRFASYSLRKKKKGARG
jgi:hypothetical protein|tara:strand:- start:548 stop:793 length:246 start_codon:yes stop_codon:yes gene_type:complete